MKHSSKVYVAFHPFDTQSRKAIKVLIQMRLRQIIALLIFSVLCVSASARQYPHIQNRSDHRDQGVAALGANPTEQWAWLKIVAGQPVDFKDKCQGTDFDPGGADEIECRVLSHGFLESMLKLEEYRVKIPPQGVDIIGAIVTGNLNLNSASLKGIVRFRHSRFAGTINLESAFFEKDLYIEDTALVGRVSAGQLHVGGILTMSKSTIIDALDLTALRADAGLKISGSTFSKKSKLVLEDAVVGNRLQIEQSNFEGGVNAATMHVAGPLIIKQSTFASFDISEATIAAQFDDSGSKLLGGLNADSLMVKGDVIFRDGTTVGGANVSLFSANIGGDIRVQQSTIKKDFDARQSHVAGGFYSRDDTHFFGKLDLSSSKFEGDVSLLRTEFSRNVVADRLRLGGTFDIDRVTLRGMLSIKSARIDGNFRIGNSTMLLDHFAEDAATTRKRVFDGLLMHVGGSAFIYGQFRDNYGVLSFENVKIDGNFEITDATFGSKLSASLLSVGRSVFIHNTDFGATPDFIGARIGEHFDIAGSKLPGLDLTRADVGGDFRVAHGERQQFAIWKPDSLLKLAFCRVGYIQDDNGPNVPSTVWPDHIELHGFSYGQFGNGSRDTAWAKRWLARTDFAEQPYLQMASYFKLDGHPDFSDEMLYASRDKERLQFKQACLQSFLSDVEYSACGHWVWLAVLRASIGYGIGNGLFVVFLWVIFFTFVGFFVLRYSPYAVGRGILWRIGASLTKLIPLVELNKDFTDFFDGKHDVIQNNVVVMRQLSGRQLIYFGFHALMGYVLASFVAAALAGLTQTH